VQTHSIQIQQSMNSLIHKTDDLTLKQDILMQSHHLNNLTLEIILYRNMKTSYLLIKVQKRKLYIMSIPILPL